MVALATLLYRYRTPVGTPRCWVLLKKYPYRTFTTSLAVGVQSPPKVQIEIGFTEPESERKVLGSVVRPVFTCPAGLSGRPRAPVVRK